MVSQGELGGIIAVLAGAVLTATVIAYFAFLRWKKRDLEIKAKERAQGHREH